MKSFRRRVWAFIGGLEAGLYNRRLKEFQPTFRRFEIESHY